MNNILQKMLTILLSIYFSVAITYNVFEKVSLIAMLILFIISFIILNKIFPKITDFSFKKNKGNFNKKELIIYGFIILIFLVVSFIASYPGVINTDTEVQWKQVQSGVYSNWHPVVETLIFLKLPSLFHNSYVSCAIFQLLFIGLILLYFCYFLRKYFFNKKGTIISLLLIILNPAVIRWAMYIYKDIPFSWCMFIGTIFIIEIVLTKGKWIENNKNKILLILTSLGIMLFRHNGIVSVFLIFLFLSIFYKNKKFYIITGILLIAFRFILYGPIYDNLNIKPNGGKEEMMGVLMNQIAYVYHQDIDITKDEQELLDKFADKETWNKYYEPATFNSLKGHGKTYGIYTHDNGEPYRNWVSNNFEDIMNFYIKYGLKYPHKYIRAYMNVTSPIWKIQDNVQFIGSSKNSPVSIRVGNYVDKYSGIITSKYIFFGVGFSLFIIVFSLFITINKRKKEWTSYLPFVLVLSNTAIIMLLLTGYECRFVYSQIICMIPLLIYSLWLNKKEGENNEQK